MKTYLTVLIILLSFSTSFSQETKCECYSKSGVKEKTGIGGWTSIIGYNSEGEQLQYHFYAAYFPPQELCIPRDNFWWQEVDAAILKAIKSHPIYKSSQIALKTDDPDATPTANSISGGAFITQEKVYEIERLPGTIVSVDAYIQERFASKLDLCSDIDKEKPTTTPIENNEQRDFYTQKSNEVTSNNNDTNSNISSINNFETSYEVYNQNLQSAFNNSFDSSGNIDVANFVSNLPQATSETQAYTNIAATGVAIAGQLMQQRRERLAREQQQWDAKNKIYKQMYQSVKDGIGQKNSKGEKTGTWFFFNERFLISQISEFKNGKLDGIVLTYTDVRFSNVFYYEEFMPLQNYYPSIYENGKKVEVLDNEVLWKKRFKNPNYHQRVSFSTQGYVKFLKKYDIMSDVGFYNSQDLNFEYLRPFSGKVKIQRLIVARYNGKSIPVGAIQVTNKQNVSILEGIYNTNGERTGNWYAFNPNSNYPKYDEGPRTNPIEKITYHDGIKQGEYYSQFWEGQFSDDRKVGLWKSKQDSGLTIKFSSDGHTGLQEKKDGNGKIIEKAIVYDTKYNGEYQSFNSNGKIKSKGNYLNNIKVDEWYFYDDNGALINTQAFDDVEKVQAKIIEEKKLLSQIGVEKPRIEPDANYSIIYFYRPKSLKGALVGLKGALVGFKVKTEDEEIIGRVKNGEKFEYKITKFGKQEFWDNNSKTSVIIDVQKGKEYYVKCAVKISIGSIKPQMNLVDNELGTPEYESIMKK